MSVRVINLNNKTIFTLDKIFKQYKNEFVQMVIFFVIYLLINKFKRFKI